jgi:hypothetical protein
MSSSTFSVEPRSPYGRLVFTGFSGTDFCDSAASVCLAASERDPGGNTSDYSVEGHIRARSSIDRLQGAGGAAPV